MLKRTRRFFVASRVCHHRIRWNFACKCTLLLGFRCLFLWDSYQPIWHVTVPDCTESLVWIRVRNPNFFHSYSSIAFVGLASTPHCWIHSPARIRSVFAVQLASPCPQKQAIVPYPTDLLGSSSTATLLEQKSQTTAALY